MKTLVTLFAATLLVLGGLTAQAQDLPGKGFTCTYETDSGATMTVTNSGKKTIVVKNSKKGTQKFAITSVEIGRNGIAGREVVITADNASAALTISYRLTRESGGAIQIESITGKVFKNRMSCVQK